MMVITLLTGIRYPLSQELNWILYPLQRKLLEDCSNFLQQGENFAFLGESLQVFAMRSRSWGKAAGRGEPGRELLSSISLSTEAAIMKWKHCFLLVFYFSCKPGANTKKKYLRCHFLDRLFIATGFFRVVLLVDSSSSWQTKAYPACSDVIVMVFTISYFKAVL